MAWNDVFKLFWYAFKEPPSQRQGVIFADFIDIKTEDWPMNAQEKRARRIVLKFKKQMSKETFDIPIPLVVESHNQFVKRQQGLEYEKTKWKHMEEWEQQKIAEINEVEIEMEDLAHVHRLYAALKKEFLRFNSIEEPIPGLRKIIVAPRPHNYDKRILEMSKALPIKYVLRLERVALQDKSFLHKELRDRFATLIVALKKPEEWEAHIDRMARQREETIKGANQILDKYPWLKNGTQ